MLEYCCGTIAAIAPNLPMLQLPITADETKPNADSAAVGPYRIASMTEKTIGNSQAAAQATAAVAVIENLPCVRQLVIFDFLLFLLPVDALDVVVVVCSIECSHRSRRSLFILAWRQLQLFCNADQEPLWFFLCTTPSCLAKSCRVALSLQKASVDFFYSCGVPTNFIRSIGACSIIHHMTLDSLLPYGFILGIV